MRAAVFVGPNQPLEIMEVPRPKPGPGEALVRVAACGVCHTDLHYIDHGVKTFAPPPIILGHEAAGVIEALGPDAHGRRVGDRVLIPAVVACGACESCRRGRENICDNLRMFGNNIPGGYAEYVAAPAKDCILMPEEIPLEEGSIIADAVSTPFHAVKNRAKVRAGESVAVFGCGGLGMNVVQCAVAFGASVIAVDVNGKKLETARALGAGETVNPADVDRVDKAIKKLTGGGVDVAFEAIGRPETIRLAFDSVRRGGRLCQVGYCAEDVALPVAKLMYYEIEMLGSLGCPTVEYPPLLDLVRRGRIRLQAMVTARLPLEEINRAFDLLRRGEGLRTIVLPGGGPGDRSTAGDRAAAGEARAASRIARVR
ncbi:MAG: zinc-binding dehydrogenase [Candidatus Latescibacteria bacterium]|nr:zinc-binding dehydrogenase [Candidatus Latescibacterota bacterium]